MYNFHMACHIIYPFHTGTMIIENFCIVGDFRLHEFKAYLAHELPNSWLREPIKPGQVYQTYNVSINCNYSDVIKLESLIQKWAEIDMVVSNATPKKGLKLKFWSLFKSN